MTRLWMAAGAVVVLAGVVLMYVFTSGPDQPDAAPTPPTPAPTLTPLEYGSEAIWSTADGENAVDVRDGVAVYDAIDKLVVADARTGVARWKVLDLKPFPGKTDVRWLRPSGDVGSRLVDRDGGLAVLTGYIATGANGEYGLALLSAADGAVLWRSPLRTSGQDLHFELTAVDDRIAVVTYQGGGTTAISIKSGKKLWTSPGRYGVGIAGDVVVTQDRKPGQEGQGKVSALDLSTGAAVWDLDDRYEGAEVVAAGGDAVVVRVLVELKTVGKVLAAGDGHELADLTDVDSCAMDSAVVACAGTSPVEIVDVDTGAVTRGSGIVSHVDLVRDGRIYVSSSDRAWTVDAAGNVIDKSLPGRVTAMTDEVGCFTLSVSFAVACHALA